MSYEEEKAKIQETQPAWSLRIDLAAARARAKFDAATFKSLLAFVVVAAVGFSFAVWKTAREATEKHWKAIAVTHAAAHYEVNDKGEVSFHWNVEIVK